jgi:hyperosmotically inducible periplasmic protein
MKNIVTLVLGSILLVTTVACEAKTSSDAPNSTDKAAEVPTAKTTESNQNDATSQVRRDQLNSDIRAREQRNNVTGGGTVRSNNDLSSEVRSKLEANIPNGSLTVTANNGAIVVAGTVKLQDQLDKIEPLAKQIKGVNSVSVNAKVDLAIPK